MITRPSRRDQRIDRSTDSQVKCVNAVGSGVGVQGSTMSGFLYYLLTFSESIASILSRHFPYDQPRYSVIQNLSESVEIRRYEPRAAIEAMVRGQDPEKATSEAFTLLFRYITGANRSRQKMVRQYPWILGCVLFR